MRACAFKVHVSFVANPLRQNIPYLFPTHLRYKLLLLHFRPRHLSVQKLLYLLPLSLSLPYVFAVYLAQVTVEQCIARSSSSSLFSQSLYTYNILSPFFTWHRPSLLSKIFTAQPPCNSLIVECATIYRYYLHVLNMKMFSKSYAKLLCFFSFLILHLIVYL